MGSYEIRTATDPCHQPFLFSFSGSPSPTHKHKINSVSISSEGNLLCSLDLKGYTDAKLNVLFWICQLMLSHSTLPDSLILNQIYTLPDTLMLSQMYTLQDMPILSQTYSPGKGL